MKRTGAASERLMFKSLDVTVNDPFKFEVKNDTRRDDHPDHKVFKNEKMKKEN